MPASNPAAHPVAAAALTKATLRAAQALGLSQQELARVLGVSASSVSRMPAHRKILPSSKEGELALLLLRVFRSLDTLLGGDAARSRAWMQAQNHHLAGVPARRIEHVEGLVRVTEYLDGMRGRL